MTYFCRTIQVLLFIFLTGPDILQAEHGTFHAEHDFFHAEHIENTDIGHVLGIFITEAELASVRASDLDAFDDAGITLYEIEGYASRTLLDFIRESDQTLFVRQSRRFVTRYQLQTRDSLFYQEDLSLVNFYRNEIGNRASVFGLFSYPEERSPVSTQLLNSYAERFDHEDELNLYYLSAYRDIEGYPASFSFRSLHLPSLDNQALPSQVIHFTPDAADAQSLADLGEILEATLEEEASIVLLPYSWFNNQKEQFELFEEVVKAYTGDGEVLSPRPRKSTEPITSNWMVILLILLLGSYIIHYRMSAYYSQSLFRYFVSHKFFVVSAIEYRLRTMVPGAILFFQHILITGLAVSIFASSSFSPLGLEAIYHSFPILALFGESTYGFFLSGMAAAFVLQSLSVLWIQITNSKTRLNQSLALYSWPLQVNFITVLMMTAVFQAGGPYLWIQALTALFLAVWFLSFNFASLDIARFLTRFRVLYIISTVGLHLLLIVATVLVLVFYPPVTEALRLALSLP